MAKIKFAPLYVNNKKCAELEDVSYEIMSNDEAQIGTEGYLCHSDGATMAKASCNSLVPVGGTTPNMVQHILNKNDVSLGLPIDGGLQKFTGRLVTVSYKSSSKNGKTEGQFSFEGGKPQVG